MYIFYNYVLVIELFFYCLFISILLYCLWFSIFWSSGTTAYLLKSVNDEFNIMSYQDDGNDDESETYQPPTDNTQRE